MFYVEVTDSTGVKWRSDISDELPTEEQRAAMDETFADFGALDHVALIADGVKHHFNPAHIVCISVTELVSS